jgi:hypothetical protein
MHRYRIAFLSGMAAGFVVGTRAGRERYEQMKKLARAAADSPPVQHAAGAVQAQAAELMKSATHKVADGLHDRVQTAAGSAASHLPGRRRRDADESQDGANHRPFEAASAQHGNRRQPGG